MSPNRRRRGAARAPSQRQLRVGELIRHAVSEILQRGEIADPVLERLPVTVPEVRMTPDLRQARVYVMPLGGEGREEVVAALSRQRRTLRTMLAGRVELKYMPELTFDIDESFDAAGRIDEILRSPEVARDLDGSDDETR